VTKFQIVSDLHYNWNYKDIGADVLIIAGDLGNGIGEIARLMDEIQDIPVFFVLGNHDYYGEITQELPNALREFTSGTNWTLLDNDSVVHEGVRLIGSTLWSELGGTKESQDLVAAGISNWPDFRFTKWINYGEIRLKRPKDLLIQFDASVKYLKFAINEPFDGKTIVITHFVPSLQAVNPRFFKDANNPYFSSDLEYLMGKDFTWVFGHTHDPYDFMVGDTRLICNPVGYRGENVFNDLIIEV
jgi:predicted phosphodiesterase